MLKLSHPIAIGHTQVGHTIESGTLDARLGDLAGHSPCAQVIAKDDLETKHGSLCQRTAMIARFRFPSLATHATNAAQVLVARQGRFGRVAMLPDAGVAWGEHRDALHPP